ncbi:hypothetical protein GJAV_G00020560 [Gymnothorax javanicus]|nr:hypothetical protein GJAV_G00020560 [Gymnothorax javanicus]
MKAFVKEYEKNTDGKIGIVELVQILPTEENFLLYFRQQLRSCTEFMQAWRNYDADHSGYIEADELKGVKMAKKEFNKIFELYDQDGNGYMDENELDALLKDLCEKNKKVLDMSKISTYKKAIMALSDGGKLYRTELALVLCSDDD